MPINVLEKNVAELIAAGEVIERPSSVIKELIENSADAGARQITVEISGGGVSFMRITDDGIGIPYDEVPTAFLRHATSKVKTELDLECITTMGFRGEALASVSAVAKVEMLTKEAGNKEGASYKISGGEEQAYSKTSCPDGTTIIVRDLFFNMPARLKFLKKDVSEGNAVQSVVEKLALINPNISFRFIRDNKPVIVTPGDGELISSIYAVFGKQFAASLISVDFEQSGVSVSGFVSSPNFCRGNRTMQYFFVNSRYVKSQSCTVALEEGFRNSMMTGKFPAAVLNIALDPALVDVNVHPAKTEVKFADDKSIFNAVYFAVKNAVLNSDGVKEIVIQKPVKAHDNSVSSNDGQIRLTTAFAEYESKPSETAKSPIIFADNTANKTRFGQRIEIDADFSDVNGDPSYKYITASKTVPDKNAKTAALKATEEISEEPSSLRVIGELWSTYIVCEDIAEKKLILIDKHAAHERIRFEYLKKEFFTSSQLLAESMFISMSSEGCGIVVENSDMLLDLGIEALDGGNNTLEITAIPSALMNTDIDSLFEDIVNVLKSGGDSNTQKEMLFDDLLHSIACKSAIKAGDKSDIIDLKMLAEAVYYDNSISFCPHGRPIITSLSKYEIEKNFKRTT